MKVLAPTKRVDGYREPVSRYRPVFEAITKLSDDEALPVEIDYRELDTMRTAVLHHFRKQGRPVTSRYDKDASVVYFQFVREAANGDNRSPDRGEGR